MKLNVIVTEIRGILEESKGYLLLPVLLSLSLTLLILTPKNGFAWGFFVLLLLRLILFKRKALILLSVSLLTLTGLVTFKQVKTNQTHLNESTREVELAVDPSTLKINGDLLSGKGAIDEETITFLYQLKSEEEQAYFTNAELPLLIEAIVQLEEPAKARNLHQFDYQNYLRFNRIHWVAKIEKITGISKDDSWSKSLLRLRLAILAHIESNLPKGKVTEYILAMIFNQDNQIDEGVMESYQKVGVIHLFSISGMHIQFLIHTLTYLLLRIGITKERTRWLLLTSIVFYGVLTGGGVGIFRSIMTHSLLLLAPIFGRDLEVKDAFALTILAALWLNPYLLFSLAFQLSYSLSGILYFLSPGLNQLRIPKLFQSVFLSFIMTAISFIFLSYHYFEVTWIGVFANIFFAFFFSICFFPLFWMISLFAVIGIPESVYGFLQMSLEKVLIHIEKITFFLAEKNWLLAITGRPAMGWYIGLTIALILFLIAIEQNRHVKKTGLLLLTSFWVFNHAYDLNPVGKVVILDVGQGDAILFIAPFHRDVILLDTGGRVSFAKETDWRQRNQKDSHGKMLVSALKAEGISHLDAVILTHGDTDHLGNLGYLANELTVDTLFVAKGMEQSETFKAEIKEIKKTDLNIQSILAPTRIALKDGFFEVLLPLDEALGTNDDSLVLLTKIAGKTWLFTGDLEEEGENTLLKRYPNLTVDYLKIGHHGSSSSTTDSFLQQMEPSVALISVGENNSYGHPDPAVVTRLKEQQVHVFRTDQQGAIHFLYHKSKNEWQIMLQ